MSALGGMRAAAFVGVLQALLFAAAIVAVGVIAWVELGGFGAFVGLLAKLGASKAGDWGAAQNGYNAYFTTPGVVQFVAGFGKEAPGRRRLDDLDGSFDGSVAYGLPTCAGFRHPRFLGPGCARLRAATGLGSPAATVGFGLVFFAVIAGVGALFLGASSALDQASLAVGQRSAGASERAAKPG